jgi:hypothetical protein
MIRLKTTIEQYSRNEDIDSDCRAITFIKQTGSASCTVNDFPLVDNQPFSINNEPGEIETTVFKIVFSGDPKLLFVIKQNEV